MRGGLIRGVTQVLRKRWAYLRELIGGKIRYVNYMPNPSHRQANKNSLQMTSVNGPRVKLSI